jgi:aryl-alcohol dehydrogenase-like predicted oxidoreductase
MNKIALGTAQFGMDYGINNSRGKVPKEEVFEILNKVLQFGVDTLDTAYSYGESEAVVGDFIGKYKKSFKVVSKLPKCDAQDVESIVDASLKKLNASMFYGYLIHNFQHYLDNPEILDVLERLKSEGKIQHIGFSLYFPRELDYILENKIQVDMIQVPYSIFDQRFERYFAKLKNRDVEIHIRSVFLQGLVFKKPEDLNRHFAEIKEKVASLNSMAMKMNIPIVGLCFNFAALNRYVDKVIVGVDGIENLKEIVHLSRHLPEVAHVYDELLCFKEDDEKIILPFYWKLSEASA